MMTGRGAPPASVPNVPVIVNESPFARVCGPLDVKVVDAATGPTMNSRSMSRIAVHFLRGFISSRHPFLDMDQNARGS